MTRRHAAIGVLAVAGVALGVLVAASFGVVAMLGLVGAVAIVLSALVLGGPQLAVFALVAVVMAAQLFVSDHLDLHVGQGAHHARFHTSHWESYPR